MAAIAKAPSIKVKYSSDPTREIKLTGDGTISDLTLEVQHALKTTCRVDLHAYDHGKLPNDARVSTLFPKGAAFIAEVSPSTLDEGLENPTIKLVHGAVYNKPY